MAFIRKIKGSLVRIDSAEYVGENTYLFYDVETGCIRISDGTPGGRPACIEGISGSVKQFAQFIDFPAVGEADVIYIDLATNSSYHWNNNRYMSLGGTGSGTNNVQEYPTESDFPVIGDVDIIYIDASSDLLYRWNGTSYVLVGSADSGSNENDFATGDVQSGSQTTIYSTTPTANLSLKFIVSIRDEVSDLFASAEVLANYKESTGVIQYTHYAKIGDPINYKVVVQSSGPSAILQVLNNSSNTLSVNVTRVSTISV